MSKAEASLNGPKKKKKKTKGNSQPAVQNHFTSVSVFFITDLVFSLSDYEQDDSESLL